MDLRTSFQLLYLHRTGKVTLAVKRAKLGDYLTTPPRGVGSPPATLHVVLTDHEKMAVWGSVLRFLHRTFIKLHQETVSLYITYRKMTRQYKIA